MPRQSTTHPALTKQIAKLEKQGGGTLELTDGVYEMDEPLRLPASVSLTMTPHAIIRALPGFKGEAVVIKDADTGDQADRHRPCGWIRGGVIDGGRQPLTGLKIAHASRLEVSELEVRDATYKGIHAAGGWYEVNLSHVRCNVDLHTRYAPGSIGIHYEKCGDSLIHSATIIGYETGVRSDTYSNDFLLVHVWNYDPEQGPMKYCFYCNGHCDTYSQCYADSPTVAGFYVTKPFNRVILSRVYYSRWAADNAGAGVLIGPDGHHGSYFGNNFFADKDHTLAKAYDGNLDSACILGDGFRGETVKGGLECRIPSGGGGKDLMPLLNLAGNGFRLTPSKRRPEPSEGHPGDVTWVDAGDKAAIYLKTSKGWKKVGLEK